MVIWMGARGFRAKKRRASPMLYVDTDLRLCYLYSVACASVPAPHWSLQPPDVMSTLLPSARREAECRLDWSSKSLGFLLKGTFSSRRCECLAAGRLQPAESMTLLAQQHWMFSAGEVQPSSLCLLVSGWTVGAGMYTRNWIMFDDFSYSDQLAAAFLCCSWHFPLPNCSFSMSLV